MYSNWSDLVRSTDMNRLLYWGIPGLPTLTVLRRVSRFQCKSHILTATQGNLTGSPFRYVNIYKCQSNGASDTDFLSPENSHWILLTAEEGGIFMRLNCMHTNCVSEGWWHQASIEVVSDSEVTHLFTIGVAYEIGATPTCNPSLKAFGLDRLAGLEFRPCSKEGHSASGVGTVAAVAALAATLLRL